MPHSIISKLFGQDLRSLAIFRMGMALVLIANLFIRLPDLTAHYTDWGTLARLTLLKHYYYPYHWSLNLYGGSSLSQYILFFISFICAIGLLLGYKTRLFVFLSWILLVSLNMRNHLVLNGGDILLALMLFWSIFLPLGAVWSLDRRLNVDTDEIPPSIFTIGTFALTLQIFLLYLFTFILKSAPEWHDGSFIYLSLKADNYATAFGAYLSNFPGLLKYLTHGIYFFESILPFLLFIPIFWAQSRTILVFSGICMHLGFGLCLNIGLFHWIDIVFWLAFLPGWFWERTLIVKGVHKVNHLLENLRLPLVRFKGIFLSPYQPYWELRFPTKFFVALALMYAIIYNLHTLPSHPVKLSGAGYYPGQLFKLSQKWNMFGKLWTYDGWHVIVGELENGQQVSLHQNWGQRLSWRKPNFIPATYKSYRWRKYLVNLSLNSNKKFRFNFVGYYCRKWNKFEKREPALKSVTAYFIYQKTLKDGSKAPVKKYSIGFRKCN